MAKKIEESVLAALSAATFEGNEMRLVGTLDRQVYQKLAKVVEAAGGKWNRKAAAHLFDGDAAAAMEPVFLTGEIVRPSDLGQFDTPPDVVDRVIEIADLHPGMKVLEPSAGIGNILSAVIDEGCEVRYVEIDPKRFAILQKIQPTGGILGDFLRVDPIEKKTRFDRIVMNPPFAPAQADIDHVLHAARFLKPGGRLVSVMASGVLFRAKTKKFVNFVNSAVNGGRFERLPDGSFKSSKTEVGTCIVTFTAPE
jgi:predicted RNA methylase